jgi:transcriptional regulator with XRE-family HTH domain/KaiC/GvpD/RAD55 family RecA-like ATPase
MTATKAEKPLIDSGVSYLNQILESLHIGDNVIWYDQAGSLASVFCLNFLQACQKNHRPLIYVSYDRSPRNLLDQLGPLAENPNLTIIDCFTWGKGAGSDVFLNFYYDSLSDRPCRIVRVDEPDKPDILADTLYGIHAALKGSVGFIFESLTGMRDLWGGEEDLITFYSHACPRLYELNTVAYWIIEKAAHSEKLRAQLNQIAQVVIELSVKRGRTSLTLIKAEKRGSADLHTPHFYWVKDLNVNFENGKAAAGRIEIGMRLKEARKIRGISQTELAKMVGVTPSTISQIESNLIYPSLPALMKMAEVLSIDASSFFEDRSRRRKRFHFPGSEAAEVRILESSDDIIIAKALTPVDFNARTEPYHVEILPGKEIQGHFFFHKGEELGYLISGRLELTMDEETCVLRPGDLIRLHSGIPDKWKNPGKTPARLFWLNLK